MTLDIASIRVALAAAQDPNAPDYAMWLAANDVPRWLEELCDEIERLRADNDDIRHKLAIIYDNISGSQISKPSTDPVEVIQIWQDDIMELEAERDDALDALKATQEELTYVKSDQWIEDVVGQVVAERDAALEKYEVLREQYVNDTDTKTIKLRAERDAALAEVKMSHDDHAFVAAERDAALAEVERLRAVDERLREGIAVVVAERCAALAQLNAACVEIAEWDKRCFATLAERDAALAEIERLHNGNFVRALAVTEQKRDAWRACADQLAIAVRARCFGACAVCDEALAEYEQLKGGDR